MSEKYNLQGAQIKADNVSIEDSEKYNTDDVKITKKTMSDKTKLTNAQVKAISSGLINWKHKQEVDFRFSAELLRAKKALKSAAEEIDTSIKPQSDFKEYNEKLQELVRKHAEYEDKDKTKLKMDGNNPVMKKSWVKAFAELKEEYKETIEHWENLQKTLPEFWKQEYHEEFTTISTVHIPKHVPLLNTLLAASLLKLKAEETEKVAISNDFILYYERPFTHKSLQKEGEPIYVKSSLALKLAYNKNVIAEASKELKENKILTDFESYQKERESLAKSFSKRDVLDQPVIKQQGEATFYEIENQAEFDKATKELREKYKECIDLYEAFVEQETEAELWMIDESDMDNHNIDYNFLDIFMDMVKL